MERPALQRLLARRRGGRVDGVVVYKVDRLSRSLIDFARIVEVFDKNKVSFVSHNAAVQHDHLDGPADAEHPALVRPVRARDDRRAHPRQVRRLTPQGHVDGRHARRSATTCATASWWSTRRKPNSSG